jgi:hypothetical protein
MSYTDVFARTAIPPSGEAYRYITLTSSVRLSWPQNYDGEDYLANINTLDSRIIGAQLYLADATGASTGADLLFVNAGVNNIDIVDADGVDVVVIHPGEAKYLWLTDNTTPAGRWSVLAYGSGPSQLNAPALVGAGLMSVNGLLNVAFPVTVNSSTINIIETHRCRVISCIGGSNTCNLPPADSLGNAFFFALRNNGTGTVTIQPQSNERIDGLTTLALAPNESCFVFCSGDAFYTIGYGRSTQFQFTKLVKDVSAGGTFTLTSAEAAAKLLQFTGTPATNVTVNVPAVVAIYYIQNSFSGQRTLTLTTAGGSGVQLNNTDRVIAYCDGVNVVSAQSTSIGSNVSIIDGSAGAPSINFASDADTGIYRAGTGSVGIAGNGQQIALFSATDVNFKGQVTAPLFIGNLQGTSQGITGTLPISQGGTGATTAAAARNAIGAAAALGFTPYDATNPAGFITGITGTMVVNALNYIPADNAQTVHTGIAGIWGLASPGSGNPDYTQQIQLREQGYAGTGAGVGPRLAFHWGGRTAAQIGIEPDGWIAILNREGTNYSAFRAGTVMEMSDEREKTNWAQPPKDWIEQVASIEKFGMFDWVDGGQGLGLGAQSLAALGDLGKRAVHVSDDMALTVHYGGFTAVTVVALCQRIIELEALIKRVEHDYANR